jgi:hypothetical protein
VGQGVLRPRRDARRSFGRLAGHIYTRSKLPWVDLPEDVPAFEVYYEMEKVWPAASLERVNALTSS